MPDFRFIRDPRLSHWIIYAPKRGDRPDQANGIEPKCPFEGEIEDLVYELGEVKVKNNKYPFAPVHEVIIHSDDHYKNFDDLPDDKAEDIFKTYRSRFEIHKDRGQVFIFNNHGENAGESLPHPHTQLAVIPNEFKLEIPPLHLGDEEIKELKNLYLFCPNSSSWPDEVWIAPKREGRKFNEAADEEIKELSNTIKRLIKIFDIKYGKDFPFNFYIYPKLGWYLRFIPRIKIIGGFEVGTNVFVNTENPKETLEFVKNNFDNSA